MSLSEGKKIPPSAATLDGKEADTYHFKESIQPPSRKIKEEFGLNEQELLKRIRQLENENAKLRNEHRKWRDRLPENARQRWGFVGSGPFPQYLSWMIRFACFKPVDVKMDKRNDKRRIVSLIEMTDKEYEMYICAVTEILDVFKKYKNSCMSLKD